MSNKTYAPGVGNLPYGNLNTNPQGSNYAVDSAFSPDESLLIQKAVRQAIFDARLNVFAYELLFRNELVDHYDGTDGDGATNRVIVNSFLLIGIKALTNGKRAFINFTANSLKSNILFI